MIACSFALGDEPSLEQLRVFCADGTPVPTERVNDNYCDCSDGADELRTGACADTYFVCENRRERPYIMDIDSQIASICKQTLTVLFAIGLRAHLLPFYKSALEQFGVFVTAKQMRCG